MRQAGMVVIAAMAVILVAACGGGTAKTTAPQGGTATASRALDNGNPQLTSTVSVKFDRPVTLVAEHVPLASLFSLQIPYATVDDIKTETVLVKTAEFASGSKRDVTLTVDRLVPIGAKVVVRKDGFEKGATGNLEIDVDSSLDVLGVLFASTAMQVTDPAVIDAGTAPAVTDADRDPAAQRTALETHLRARGSDDESIDQALATFDAMPAEIVTSPKIRAALAALTGTFAEPAIDSLLTGDNCTGMPAAVVAFQEPPGDLGVFARVTYASNGARVVSLSPSLEGEQLELLMPILLHEAIHCDQVGGRFEEVAATAIDSYFWLNLLATFPDLATGGTPLTREFNVDAIALINSGRKIPESIGVLKSPGVSAAVPGTTAPYASFAELVAAAYPSITYNESPEEPLAQAYVQALAQATGMPEDSAFNLAYLDELLARSATPELVQRAVIALNLAPA